LADPSAITVPFREQAEFWRRKVNVPTASWRDLQREDHAHGFMVAGAARLDLVDDLRKAVDRAILEGGTIADFRRDFDAIVARTGWQYQGGRNWRTRIIYTTNVRSAYMAGRWQQIQAIKHRRPFLQYVHNDSVRHPRPDHLSWNGKVLAVDDPWWSTHFPPNGYGCQCTVITLAQRDLARAGKDGPDQAPTETEDTAGIDPGFDYNGGIAASSMPSAVRFGQKVMQLPADWRGQVLTDAQQRPQDSFAGWAGTMRRVVAELTEAEGTGKAVQPRGTVSAVGFLRPAVADAIVAGRTGLPAQAAPTALLAVEDQRLYHALRSAKGEDAAVLRQALIDLLRWLSDAASGVLWDSRAGNLVYAHRLADGRYIKLAFDLEQRAERNRIMRKAQLNANWLRTAGIVENYNLREAHYVLLDGAIE